MIILREILGFIYVKKWPNKIKGNSVCKAKHRQSHLRVSAVLCIALLEEWGDVAANWGCGNVQGDCGNKDLQELVQDLLPLGVLIDTLNSWLFYWDRLDCEWIHNNPAAFGTCVIQSFLSEPWNSNRIIPEGQNQCMLCSAGPPGRNCDTWGRVVYKHWSFLFLFLTLHSAQV